MNKRTEALYDPAALGAVERKLVQIRVVEGADKGASCQLTGSKYFLGTGPGNCIPLSDTAVSRKHVSMKPLEAGLLVEDLGSTNGTFLNDIRIHKALWSSGSVMRIGTTELVMEFEEETVDVPVYKRERLLEMVGRSDQMQELFGQIARIAPTEATVLVVGESGTGKELVSRAIHTLSNRSSGPSIVFDCGAVPTELIASELFGHAKGAFTGATADRKGAFRAANGGTLFLDEIGDLALDLQPKLLRALEAREVKPVGVERAEKVDVRVVAATHRDLAAMVREGTFRQDLYYRLAQIELRVAPLRERSEDIPLLVKHFVEHMSPGSNYELGYELMERLKTHPWDWNIRELKNYVDRAVLLSQDGRLDERYLNAGGQPSAESAISAVEAVDGAGAGESELQICYDRPFKEAKSLLVESFEKAYWSQMLEAHGWNISAAARAAGIHRKSLEYVVRKLQLKKN